MSVQVTHCFAFLFVLLIMLELSLAIYPNITIIQMGQWDYIRHSQL